MSNYFRPKGATGRPIHYAQVKRSKYAEGHERIFGKSKQDDDGECRVSDKEIGEGCSSSDKSEAGNGTEPRDCRRLSDIYTEISKEDKD